MEMGSELGRVRNEYSYLRKYQLSKNVGVKPEAGEEILIKIKAKCSFSGGKVWEEPLPPSSRLVRIFLSYGPQYVESIQMVVYHQVDKRTVISEKHGGDGTEFKIIELRDHERITCVSGEYLSAHDRITRIQFETSMGFRYGPFGTSHPTGSSFRFEVGTLFGGFHGRSCDSCLRAIGVYVKSGATSTWSSSSNCLTAA